MKQDASGRISLAATRSAVRLRAAAPLGAAVVLAALISGGPPATAAPREKAPSLAGLRCEYKVDPLGIDAARPRLSWQLRSDARGVVQSAYQVQVTRNGTDWRRSALAWDTGKVASDRSTLVPYDGPALESARRYYWRVRVWDGGGRASAWSAPAYWEMGLLRPEDWKARWITPDRDEDAKTPQPSPLLRGSFSVAGQVRSARAYVSALGLYELELNGRRVGDQLFTPGWTSYHHRIQYQTYDVTALLRPGANALGATLGDGWYRGYLGWGGRRDTYGDRLAAALSAQDPLRRRPRAGGRHRSDLEVGHRSHPHVRHLHGRDLRRPAGAAGLERRRLRRRAAGRAFASSTPSRRRLVAPAGPAVRRIEEVHPVEGPARRRPGRPSSTWARTWSATSASRVSGPAGTKVTLRHAEVLDKAGQPLHREPPRGEATLTYILKGGGGGGLRAALHLPGLPLRRGGRLPGRGRPPTG